MTTLYDSMKARDEGIDRAGVDNGEWLKLMRDKARVMFCCGRKVNTDSLRPYAEFLEDEMGIAPRHPNAWGGIFRHPDWVQDGTWQQSDRVSSHARRIWNWKLRTRDGAA